jgi:DNA-binding transcriptional LysR family regulator
MDLNHVAAFVRVVDTGSFTLAAKALGVPKSSVSRSVASLERELGVRLLHRTTRQLHVTDAGAELHHRASRALTEIHEATDEALSAQRELRGTIRISAPADLGVWAVAPIVSRFVRRHPSVKIDVRLSGRIVDLVSERFDLAVRAGAIRDESLVARACGSFELGLYASSRYATRRALPLSVDELAVHDCILFRSDTGALEWRLRSKGGEHASVEPRASISADDISFLKKAALAGAGIALLPAFMVAREVESGKLERVLPAWSHAASMLHVVYPSARYVPRRIVLFRDYLATELVKLSRRSAAESKSGGSRVNAASRVKPLASRES